MGMSVSRVLTNAPEQDAIVLQKNHSVYDLPKGTVVETCSDEYCTGDATLVPQVLYMMTGGVLPVRLQIEVL